MIAPLSVSTKLNFLTERDLEEFNVISPRLRALLLEVSHYSQKTWGIVPIITHLLRTQEEQEAIYGIGTYKRSPHQYGRAADLRSRIYTIEQVAELVNYLNKEFPRGDKYKTALYHTVGRGWHLHLQVAP